MSERDYTATVQTRNMGDLAREEIRDARRAGVDPLDIAQTHRNLALLIPHLLEQEGGTDA